MIQFEYAPVEYSTNSSLLLRKAFLDALGRGDFIHVSRCHFPVERGEEAALDAVKEVLPDSVIVRSVTKAGDARVCDALFRGEGWWALLDSDIGHLSIEIGANDVGEAEELCQRVESRLNVRVVPETVTRVRVSTKMDNVAYAYPDVAWADVARNYSSSTRDALARLARLSHDDVGKVGRVILLHGLPGTGKTWAVRSLLSEWKSWADGVIVVDPEELIDDPLYLLRITRGGAGSSCRAVVVEDADQLVERRGTRSMGLSRLLNVADGIVGGSHDFLLIVTTNSAPASLDPALLRPGRCLAAVEFGPLDARTVGERLGDRFEGSGMTLAELYLKSNEGSMIESRLTSFGKGMYL